MTKKSSTSRFSVINALPISLFRGFIGYLLALALCGIALFFRLLIAPIDAGVPFLTFFPAVTLAVLFAGVGPALFAMLLSSVLVSYLFIPPFAEFPFVFQEQVVWSNIIFCLEELLVIIAVAVLNWQRKHLLELTLALQADQARLQLVADSVDGFATFLLDPDGRVISWNKGSEKLTGYTEEEIIGQNYACFYPAEENEVISSEMMLEKALTHGIYHTDGWRMRKDNTRYFADALIAPYFDEQQQLKGYVKIQRDISERYRYEQHLKAIIQSVPVPIIVVNAAGNIVLVNPRTEVLFGYQTNALLTKPLEIIIPERYRELHKQHFAYYLNNSSTRAMGLGRELTALRQNGEEFPVEIGLSAIALNGELQVVATVYDISQRRQEESVLLDAKNKSEALNKAKGEFLANMSHEIRTPMNAIIGLTQLTLDSNLTTKQRDYLRKVYRSSKALLSILDDILDYSKIEAGKLNIEHLEFTLEEVVDNVSDLFSLKIAEKGLELFLDIDRNINFQLIGDPLRLGQILNNLLSNAIRKITRSICVLPSEILVSAWINRKPIIYFKLSHNPIYQSPVSTAVLV